MDRYLNVTEARNTFLDLIEQLHDSDRIVITKRGQPRAVLVDSERFALLEDLAWVLQDPGRRAALQQAWNEMRGEKLIVPAGRTAPTVAKLRRLARRRRSRRAKS